MTKSTAAKDALAAAVATALHTMHIQFNSLRMRIKSVLQRVSCEHALVYAYTTCASLLLAKITGTSDF